MSRFPEVSVPEFTRSLRAKWVRGITQRDARRVDGVRTVSAPTGGAAVPAQTRGGEHQTLLTADGVRLSAVHVPGRDREWAFVVCHGFTGTWSGPHMTRVVTALRPFGGVVAFDFRGHGRSRGRSTVGDLEVFDVHAAVEWARVLGYRNVATVGFSMGASVVVRHGGLCASGAHSSTTDAVVSVSGPGWWFERSTLPMKWIHWLVLNPMGRFVSDAVLKTRVLPNGWDPVPESPVELAPRIAPVPLLVVHGDADRFFPLGHAEALYAAAKEPRSLWIEAGFGHAEAAADVRLLRRIGRWVTEESLDLAKGTSR